MLQGPLNSVLGVFCGFVTESVDCPGCCGPCLSPFQLCLFPVMRSVAVDDNRAYSEAWMLFKDCTTFLPNDVSMLLMITQQCMADAFYPLTGFQHCFCPELLRSHQPAVAICSFQALDRC